MEKYLAVVDLAHFSGKVGRFWFCRLLQMLRHMTVSNHGFGYSPISDVEVDANWPLGDSKIRFTRDNDGAKVRLYLDGKRWVGEVING